MNISKHISYKEAVRSQTAVRKGIDNVPSPEQIRAMKLVADKCFEPVREHFGVQLFISSFFRSEQLNMAIGGSRTSEHCKGMAIDIDADYYGGVTNAEIFYYIMNNLEFNQLIWEYGTEDNPAWVHVSYRESGNRNQILRATSSGYKTYE